MSCSGSAVPTTEASGRFFGAVHGRNDLDDLAFQVLTPKDFGQLPTCVRWQGIPEYQYIKMRIAQSARVRVLLIQKLLRRTHNDAGAVPGYASGRGQCWPTRYGLAVYLLMRVQLLSRLAKGKKAQRIHHEFAGRHPVPITATSNEMKLTQWCIGYYEE